MCLQILQYPTISPDQLVKCLDGTNKSHLADKKSQWQQNKDQLLTALVDAGYITADGHLTAQWDADQALSQLHEGAMLYRKLLVDVCATKDDC